jgi:hypothetical protein
MLIHILRNVRNVKIGVVLVGKLLEFGIERFLIAVSPTLFRIGAQGEAMLTLAKLTSYPR